MDRTDFMKGEGLEMICPLFQHHYTTPAKPCCDICNFADRCIFIEIYLKLANLKLKT